MILYSSTIKIHLTDSRAREERTRRIANYLHSKMHESESNNLRVGGHARKEERNIRTTDDTVEERTQRKTDQDIL
jgi:hypothetical protein